MRFRIHLDEQFFFCCTDTASINVYLYGFFTIYFLILLSLHYFIITIILFQYYRYFIFIIIFYFNTVIAILF